MKYVIAAVTFVLGGGLGYILAPKENNSSELKDSRKEIKTVSSSSAVSKSDFSEDPQVMITRVFTDSGITPKKINKLKSPQDWFNIIQREIFEKPDIAFIADNIVDISILMKLVPDEHIPEVINLLESKKGRK